MSDMGLNRKLVRAIYPVVDWDQYDREVIAEHEAAAPQPLDLCACGRQRASVAGMNHCTGCGLMICSCVIRNAAPPPLDERLTRAHTLLCSAEPALIRAVDQSRTPEVRRLNQLLLDETRKWIMQHRYPGAKEEHR